MVVIMIVMIDYDGSGFDERLAMRVIMMIVM